MTTAFAVAAILVFLRVAGFVVFLPPFSGSQIPATVKIGLAMALTVVWGLKLVPELAASLSPELLENWILVGWLSIRETLFGVSLGWLLGLVLVPIRVAGAYVVQEMGLTMATVTSATEGSESNVISQLLEIGAVLFLFGSSLDHQFLRLLNSTFELFPLGRAWQLPQLDWLIGSMSETSQLGLSIAAPVGVTLFVALIASLIIMRQAPQFNLFSFGTPIRLVAGLAALIWFLPSILTGMVHNIKTFTSFAGL